MIPTQGRKIWMGAAALLALWALLAWLSLARLAEFEALQASRDRSRATATLLRESTRALADMESGNRAFFLAASERARLPFDTGRASLIRSYKQLEIQYRSDKKSLNELREFKKPLNRWFALSNPAIAQRRAAGTSPNNALLSRLARSEEERAAVMQNARDILIGLSNAQEKRALALASQQEAARLAVRSMTLATIGVGVFGIAGLAMLLARQAVRIGESNESLRREVENRRRAERERQILANHDEQILNSTIEGIVALNVKGRVTFVNPSAAAMLGWEVSELLGKPWHDMAQHSKVDNVRQDKELSPVLATLRDATARRISDDVFWKRTGKHFPVEYAVNPLWELSPRENEDRQLSGATVTFRDITERKRSEIALLRLASVVESSKDAILSHLLDGTIVSCNASAVKMYGYSAREMEGQSLAVLFPPSRAEEAQLITEHIQRGERIEPYQTMLLGKGGSKIDVAITFYPVRDARGNLMGASSNARPIRKGTQTELPSFQTAHSQASTTSAAANAANGTNGASANGAKGTAARSEVSEVAGARSS